MAAAEAIDFYEKAFGARERLRLEVPGGKIAHAEIEIADSLVMLCDPLPQFVSEPPPVLGGTSGEVLMYVDDVDAVVQQAVDAGATITTEVVIARARSPTRLARCG
jgi:PhnB protein